MRRWLPVAWCEAAVATSGKPIDANVDSSPVELSTKNEITPASTYPLQFENFSKDYNKICLQDNYDGFRLEIAKSVTKRLQASHSLLLGTAFRDGGSLYSFGPTFATDDGNTAVMARYSTDGCSTARLIKRLGTHVETRAQISSSLMDKQRNACEFVCEGAGSKSWATALKVAWQGTWVVNGAFSRALSPYLHVGGDLTWIAINGATTASAGGRWSRGKNTITVHASRQPDFRRSILDNSHSFKLQYVRKVSDRLGLATEYEVSHPDMASALRMGYEYTFRQAVVQGLLDTAGTVTMSAQDNSGFGVSGTADLKNHDYRFGFMLHMFPEEKAK